MIHDLILFIIVSSWYQLGFVLSFCIGIYFIIFRIKLLYIIFLANRKKGLGYTYFIPYYLNLKTYILSLKLRNFIGSLNRKKNTEN